jgi:hypothetical protein
MRAPPDLRVVEGGRRALLEKLFETILTPDPANLPDCARMLAQLRRRGRETMRLAGGTAVSKSQAGGGGEN